MMAISPLLLSVVLTVVLLVHHVQGFAAGKGFGASSSSGNKSVIGGDRFKSVCPADPATIKQFDSTLVSDDADGSSDNNDTWVAVYRSKNNLPSVFVRDSFFDAMAVATTAQGGDSQTLVSVQEGTGVISGNLQDAKPVAVARLTASKDNDNISIIDSMRCTLKKEETDFDCDGGSEHAEAIGACIDELVLSYLQRYLETESSNEDKRKLHFDGGIRFRGTLVSGRLLEARGFREATQLSADMHSHESDFDGALQKYAERSTSREISKSPGARDRALKIISLLSKIDRDEDQKRESEEEDDDEGESDFDPWASVKRYL
ncbi:hypothetical protein ACHAWC_008484 [Mediolabrus comicus]